ncbi:hypothetical protein [Caldilinea sp.]|jgi:lipopolysaccharide/colanic/teichoic acid biosynthesis glycosyltransferase|uniref:hypothetical protein n=1 Tax=Caldilinea sp. TaxID=2293560 RepID=UPI001B128DCE|nr:hypothetical protein [Caldilinea sp.]MBO9394882.1 hypothetical protein [Caldilinea sp.]
MHKQTGTFWERTKRATKRIADFQAKVILTILYIVMALPTGLVVRISEDALSIRRQPGEASYWHKRHTPKDTIREARRQG